MALRSNLSSLTLIETACIYYLISGCITNQIYTRIDRFTLNLAVGHRVALDMSEMLPPAIRGIDTLTIN